MDMRMPRADGPEATRRILETRPDAKLVMRTVSGDEDGVVDAVKSGAQGYLLKTIDPPALFDALRGVVRGEAARSSGLAAKIMLAFARQAQRPAATAPPGSDFSLRAQKVMALVVDGKSNTETATALCLAENTVKNILATLHLGHRVQVAAFALRTQGVPPAHGAVPQVPADTAAPCAPRG